MELGTTQSILRKFHLGNRAVQQDTVPKRHVSHPNIITVRGYAPKAIAQIHEDILNRELSTCLHT
jgi:hypothetical protein